MLEPNSHLMATEDYAVMAAVVGVAIIVGFILGKISQKADYNRRLDQKIGLNELERWKLRPKYANIMMEKKPEVVAQKELNSLLKQKQKNDDDLEDIAQKFELFAEEMEILRGKISRQKSVGEQKMIAENLVSAWLAKVTELRTDAEDCNDINIGFGYQKRFLKFVISGDRKPTIVDRMDKVATDEEMKNPGKKSADLMNKIIESMKFDESDVNSFFKLGIDNP